ncbi:MAG: hypothetical protein EOO54_15710 [Haliea sp.]|nr:MAG: hypothetical protein EOO54_15710 [Haliea sp.]
MAGAVLPSFQAASCRSSTGITKAAPIRVTVSPGAISSSAATTHSACSQRFISTSEIKTSVVIDEKYMELAVRALHKAFDLDQPAGQS